MRLLRRASDNLAEQLRLRGLRHRKRPAEAIRGRRGRRNPTVSARPILGGRPFSSARST